MNADTLYRTLLAACPPGFRREYGDAMLEAFRDLHLTRSHGRVRFWPSMAPYSHGTNAVPSR